MSERAVCTVSELAMRIKASLEDQFPAVWVEGEISNLRTPSSGHAYFTLKDDTAQLRCVLFRGRGRRVAFQPEDGMQVLAFGGLDVYLWAFNDERVARAIAACRVPVISAVGHETDFTIADFVADLRAPTPSAAAELVVQEKLQVVHALCDLYESLKQVMADRLERERERVDALAKRRVLTDASRALRDLHRRLDEMTTRLGLAARRRHQDTAHRVSLARNALRSLNPVARIANGTSLLAQLRGRLTSAAGHSVKASRHPFDAAAGQLDTLSPLAVLPPSSVP